MRRSTTVVRSVDGDAWRIAAPSVQRSMPAGLCRSCASPDTAACANWAALGVNCAAARQWPQDPADSDLDEPARHLCPAREANLVGVDATPSPGNSERVSGHGLCSGLQHDDSAVAATNCLNHKTLICSQQRR